MGDNYHVLRFWNIFQVNIDIMHMTVFQLFLTIIYVPIMILDITTGTPTLKQWWVITYHLFMWM